ncbi:MAG: hypothetical protein HYV17_03005 [Xanthomonadales bacterium]|nr:hypothetical protein [Xanthomonadales bacterium]
MLMRPEASGTACASEPWRAIAEQVCDGSRFAQVRQQSRKARRIERAPKEIVEEALARLQAVLDAG